MRIEAMVCAALAVGGCQRDRPAVESAPTELAQPVAPEASRPVLVQDEPPDADGALDCFQQLRQTAVEQWLRVYAVGDMNGDGRPDAVIGYDILTDDFTSYVAVWLGDGEGGFREADEVAIGPMAYDIALADLDGDGDLDVLAPSVKQRKVVVLLGRGDGTLARGDDVRVGPRPGQVVAADFDGDGDADAVVLHDREYQFLRGDGNGRLRAGKVVKAEEAPEQPAVADLDGDGVLDLLFVHNDSMTAVALLGRGDGTFAPAARVTGVCDGPYSVVSGDFDRDGAPDGAFGCLRTDVVRTMRNAGGAERFELDDIQVTAGQALGVGDVTGDGIADIVTLGQRVGRPIRSNTALLVGDGRGGFAVRSQAVIDGHFGKPLLADVNGDGRLDIVSSAWYGRRPGQIAVWLGTACQPSRR